MIYAITVFARDKPAYAGQDTACALVAAQLDQFDPPEIRALRKRLTPNLAMIYRPSEWLMVPDPWHQRRIVLISNAAHATTAHMLSGGGMAIEDGVVLGEMPDDSVALPQALDRFKRRRFERVRIVVDTSVALSAMEAEARPWLNSRRGAHEPSRR